MPLTEAESAAGRAWSQAAALGSDAAAPVAAASSVLSLLAMCWCLLPRET
jgi:hypothetical protein